jgi:predicted transcriptional regulator
MLQVKSTAFEKEFDFRENKYKKTYSKSKLSQYLDILEFLANNGPIKFELIMQQIEFNCSIALERMSYLVKLNLVEEKKSSHTLIYSITSQGEKVVRFFKKPSCLPRL